MLPSFVALAPGEGVSSTGCQNPNWRVSLPANRWGRLGRSLALQIYE